MTDKPNRPQHIALEALMVMAGTHGPQSAALTLNVDGDRRTHQSTGNGPVDAIFNAIRALVPHDARLLSVNFEADNTTDSLAVCSVALSLGDIVGVGYKTDPDVLVAAAMAYVAALNNISKKIFIDGTIPASDRYVDLSDNSKATTEIMQRLE